ncbi:MAG: hypothetical protein J6K75_09650 [Erysipelotrichaceae bacterium]|nr:hypothetical protein [Erysipelotrichaceae bacterium]MBQ7890119.1 hypothetical protein [Erysipelotrichaceae bacterium]
MKSKTLKIRNIPTGNPAFFRMNVKPIEYLTAILIVSIVFLFCDAPLPTVGLILCTVICFALVATPDRTLLEINELFIVFYSPKDSTECSILYWDEILTWQYQKQRQCDHLKIELINGDVYDSEVYHDMRLIRLLQTYAAGKEKKTSRRRKTS